MGEHQAPQGRDRRQARQDLHAPHQEITVASRLGSGDPSFNPRLRLAVDKATDQNMPKDTIERAIKRGSGGLEGVNYEEIRYEGYGINGAAVIVDCMTDNRTRTVADVRHAFSKYGGNLGTDGSVAYLFKHCGQIVFAPGTNEDKVIEAAIDAGAEDVMHTKTAASRSSPSRTVCRGQGRARQGRPKARARRVTMKPTVEVEMHGEDAQRMQRLLDALEAIDDVQEIHTSAVISE
jgi:YebC/PmpR family DNA-binding regulatory protein